MEPVPEGVPLTERLVWARTIWKKMTRTDRWIVLNSRTDGAAVYWERNYLRSCNRWQKEEHFSLDRVLLPHGGQGYGDRRTYGECRVCGVELPAWRRCDDCVRFSNCSGTLDWCLSCEDDQHIADLQDNRCPTHEGPPTLQGLPEVPVENWDDDPVVEEREQEGEIPGQQHPGGEWAMDQD